MLTLAVVVALLSRAGVASAATYEVDTPLDNVALSACGAGVGDCSLRGAIDKANGSPGTDFLTFSVDSVTLDEPMIPITEKLTVTGAGTTVIGSGSYAVACQPDLYAFDLTTAQVELDRLPIYNVCGRPIRSDLVAPSLRIGPRRSDNTVSFNGTGGGASVDIYRADSPAGPGEALEYFESAVAPGGIFSSPLPVLPPTSEKFTAAATDSSGRTSSYSATASTPADLTSPVLNNAVANANNSVRLDFSESISGNITGVLAAFTLKMGAANRQVTSVDVSGNSVYVGSASTPWSTGEAGTVAFSGNGRVTDTTGNEVLGEPSKLVYAGPGEISGPVVSRYRASPTKFCQRKTAKCRRGQTYLYVTLNKPARVIFNVYRLKGRRPVVKYVRRLPAGTSKTRLFGTINGRTLPATSLLVNAVAEDAARNLSPGVDAAFKVVTRKSQL
ncbi:MAG: hypothetical protein JHD02_01525 [Thermoleophilaceae bacterium]|nr:hypothetical protein [Thermoleophilaceae bacterium]